MNPETPEVRDGLPPFARSWGQLYAWVVVSLLAMIGFLWWFTGYFS